ncbi:ATP-binding protein ['Opuntia sp.' phytoplasma]|uniref:ATP-binding protein n=1 Tax=Candidatus Phytoplasma asiaticum TaxID=2763338 RepID=A0AAX3B8P0_9MOLU|nr:MULTISPECIES: ATP-binding protein [Phytoplasma]MDO8054119.1 ATP-binding protein ['Opuntia sp.' phytoplasma]MDO8057973.1 ATP-binding protein ['Opuntia sp.' phytoplasma]UQV27016.1 ATP-binding protein ['Parthenium hysterophorus' phyllody phytoplasma]
MFIGRQKELKILKEKINSNHFEFGLIYGRRRIGKTRLLKEINKHFSSIYFVADETGLDINLQRLSQEISFYFQEPITFSNYENLFIYLAKKSQNQKIILMIDEFSYLLKNNTDILSILQNIIDKYLQNSNIKLILSGSHIGILEDIFAYHKPLYGRKTFQIKLKTFDYAEANLFYPQASLEDKIIFYSIFGGLPFYLQKIDDTKSVKDNVINLILEDGAIFEDEINFFLTQEVRNIKNYSRILNSISLGNTQLSNITSKSGIQHTGTTSKYLDILQNLDIVGKEICFGKKNQKKTLYFIKDQFFHFSFYFLEKNKSQKIIMNKNNFYETVIQKDLDKYVSLEFEKICQSFLIKKNKMNIEEIGRYWGNEKEINNPKNNVNLEIDIILKTNKNVSIFECKWSNQKINMPQFKQLNIKKEYIKKIFSYPNIILGFFSKKGYQQEIIQNQKDIFLYNLEDLYSL